MDWLEQLADATSELETPKSFIYWGGLCAVSAVLNNRVYIDRGGPEIDLAPNLYVLLIARSGMRKGLATSISKRLVQEVNNTRVIAGRSSFQAIIKHLSEAIPLGGGKYIKDSIAYINSGEFSTGLVRDPDALTVLTDLYDGHYNREWVNTLKGSGKEKLKNVCITLLGAMNQTHFNDIITAKEISGGFIGRCILVMEEKRAKKNSLIYADKRKKISISELSDHLKKIAELSGVFELTDDAKKSYDDWYNNFDAENVEDKTGTANRLGDNILKVAMCVAAARTGIQLIEKSHIEEAMDVSLNNTVNVSRVTAGTGVDEEYSKMLRIFLAALYTAPEYTVERQSLLTRNYGNFDKWGLDRMVEHIQEAGGIEVLKNPGDPKTYYRLTEKAIQGLTKDTRRLALV